jgi:hypothetical protein
MIRRQPAPQQFSRAGANCSSFFKSKTVRFVTSPETVK